MVKAIWKDKVLAETDDHEIIEGNYYFPPGSVKKEYFKHSNTHTICPIKGFASYYDVVVDDEVNKDAPQYIVKDLNLFYISLYHGMCNGTGC